jgi:hypothetical protein
MTITLSHDLESVLTEQARQQGVPPETLAVNALREKFLPTVPEVVPQDEC